MHVSSHMSVCYFSNRCWMWLCVANPLLFWLSSHVSLWSSSSFSFAIIINLIVAFFYPFSSAQTSKFHAVMYCQSAGLFLLYVDNLQWWANPNRNWDLNRDLSVFWEWFDKFWDWFGMRDWDLIRFSIFCDSIRSVGFDSRILASCRSGCLNSRGSAAAAWTAATAAGRPKQLTNWQQHFQSD